MAARKKPAPKRGASRYKAPSKRPVPGWIWLACGLVVGVFAMLLFNLQPGSDAIKRDKPQPERASTTPKPQPSSTSQEPGKPKYDFYTLLPESEVIVPPDALPPPATPTPEQKPVTPEEAAKIDAARAQAALNGQTPPPAPPVAAPPAAVQAPLTTQFFLQAGSFRRKDDAEGVRAQITLLGQSVRVESGTVRDETWHRVLVGPFANREQLAQSQKTLAANGFSNLLLQQRQSR
ncbi:SPOR domain-containing protein [Pseudomonas seleniipraecipitans]|uniref:Cell division protein FtsN n=1 Tax=Phytopseudomonas seleniipraecipitans TaxID=640205 RepID=A0A1G7LVR6_9GAMM|nr:SPOR domain-containing protein [Pseudomonas seleniipraecipitans]UUD62676.1 SPOR domain-containing protein [Pseudomonas seleniipraecipitans]SDF53585.1 Cell division protein FtsN [Pseudomonas seleniipraecipitans]